SGVVTVDQLGGSPQAEAGGEPERAGGSDFELLDRLGAGSMGVVYLARDRNTGQRVALKTLHKLVPAALLRLKNEFRRVADLSHPNLVGLYELRSSGEHWYFTMEYIEGRSFHALLDARRSGGGAAHTRVGDSLTGSLASATSGSASASVSASGSLVGAATGSVSVSAGTLASGATETLEAPSVGAEDPESEDPDSWSPKPLLEADEIRSLFVDLIRGVSALHGVGMLHCDIKPANVMVAADRARLLDFGLVVPRVGEQGESLSLSGTPAYMAPEQAAGMAPSEASDWYAIGTMLYEVLGGRRPFLGSTMSILAAKLERDAPPLPEHVQRQSPALARLATALLTRDAEQRPKPAEIFAAFGVEPDGAGTLGQRGLVGRDDELAALHAALDACAGRRPVVVELHGRSGTGKSALTDRFLDEASRRADTIVLRGRCYERESVPYKAFDAVVDALTRYLRRLPRVDAAGLMPRDIHELARVFPVLE
ncbi:MAG: serine/threonine-protein kinase PknK, partial [Myxococcales bacterium]|nr:serine/threonine-protein kinase PknK [Myxococcales bacterium]